MPMPKRASVTDYFTQLTENQRPHLQFLRQLSKAADPAAEETLKYNLPVYVRDGTTLWMLQNFKHHCSLRFPPPFFALHTDQVKAAGYDMGAAFVKLPYDRDVPVELCRALMAARVAEYEDTGAGWNDAR